MTAYLVLRDHPLRLGEEGPTVTLIDADVADTDRRRRQQESVLPIAAGEQLSERQALQALLLPSANNIAAVLARWAAGSADRFVAAAHPSDPPVQTLAPGTRPPHSEYQQRVGRRHRNTFPTSRIDLVER
jgi:hypothetical protein